MKIQTNRLLGAVNLNRIPDVDAGWSSLVARRAHNPKVVGSNPAPATKLISKTPFGVFVYWLLT